MTTTTSRTTRKSPRKAAVAAEKDFQPEFMMVDPTTLVIGVNIRTDTKLDPEDDEKAQQFIDSVRENGVIEDIAVYRDPDAADPEALIVWRGQRRTKTAIMTGRPLVPVRTRPKPTTADRITEQIIENDPNLRREMTRAEVLEGYRQLEMEGLTVAQIAKRTSHDKAEIIPGLIVAKSQVARQALEDSASLTLERAAVVAEFDDDPDDVDYLLAGTSYQFDYRAETLRGRRAEAAAITAATQALVEAGITVIDEPDLVSVITPLNFLRQDGEPVTVDSHAGCPGHAAHLDPEDQEPVYVCTDPQEYGHEDVTPPIEIPTRSGSTTPLKAADMDPAQRQAAKEYRRDTIQCNKDWAAATKVRRRWLTEYLTRATPPKDAAAFIAQALASCDHALTRALTDGHKLALDLLSVGGSGTTAVARRAAGASLGALIEKARSPRAQVITLAMILGAYEAATYKTSWRDKNAGTQQYLRYLESLKYPLSPVERRACGESAEAAENGGQNPVDDAQVQDVTGDGEVNESQDDDDLTEEKPQSDSPAEPEGDSPAGTEEAAAA